MPEIEGNVTQAFLLTLFAGLSTGIGSLIAYFVPRPRLGLLSFSLGLSAGVMIYISFMEMLPESMELIGDFYALVVFFAGILFMAIIDHLIPERENPHEYKFSYVELDELSETEENKKISSDEYPSEFDSGEVPRKDKLLRMGLFTAFAIAIHNFPEGIVTFSAVLLDPDLGLFIAIAIAIHNIPEGISVSIPIYYSTGSRRKALVLSFLSGLAEPLGALLAFFFLSFFLSPVVLAASLGFIAGIMVYLSLDEILPLAHQYGNHHIVIAGVVLGMLLMGGSILMLEF